MLFSNHRNVTKGNEMNKYFYRPLSFFGGRVLKCAGICNETNAEWFPRECETAKEIYQPGVIVLEGYRGDRINADDESDDGLSHRHYPQAEHGDYETT